MTRQTAICIITIVLSVAMLFVTMRYISEISNKPNSEIKEIFYRK